MSRNVQTTSVAAGASIVVTNARPAIGLAASALPALKPNHPNQSRPAPSSTVRHVVRQDRRAAEVRPLADDERGHQRRGAGVHVHDRAAGEVPGAHVSQPAAAPDPVGQRRVDDDRPERDEGQVGGKPHALDDGAGDQRRGDDAERGLERHVQRVGNRQRHDRAGLGEPDAVRASRTTVSPSQLLPGDSASE